MPDMLGILNMYGMPGMRRQVLTTFRIIKYQPRGEIIKGPAKKRGDEERFNLAAGPPTSSHRTMF